MKTKGLDGLTDLHMVVISWLKLHPGHTPEDIAKRLRADVDEIGQALRGPRCGWVHRANEVALRYGPLLR